MILIATKSMRQYRKMIRKCHSPAAGAQSQMSGTLRPDPGTSAFIPRNMFQN